MKVSQGSPGLPVTPVDFWNLHLIFRVRWGHKLSSAPDGLMWGNPGSRCLIPYKPSHPRSLQASPPRLPTPPSQAHHVTLTALTYCSALQTLPHRNHLALAWFPYFSLNCEQLEPRTHTFHPPYTHVSSTVLYPTHVGTWWKPQMRQPRLPHIHMGLNQWKFLRQSTCKL